MELTDYMLLKLLVICAIAFIAGMLGFLGDQ